MDTKLDVLPGLVLPPQLGERIWRGDTKAIILPPDVYVPASVALIAGQRLYGIANISGPFRVDREAAQALADELGLDQTEAKAGNLWLINQLWVYPEAIPYDAPVPGQGRLIPEVKLPKPEELEQVAKLHLETFRSRGVDYDLLHPYSRWRELLADLRYLGNAAYPRLKAGKKWGEWTLDDVLRYFGAIIDTLRKKCYFPLRPPKAGDPAWDMTSFWACYREAKEKGYIKTEPPPPEQEKTWAARRQKLLKARQAALAIILRPGKKEPETLLIRRKNPPRVWSPPGGFLSGREPIIAAQQEAQEETGVELRPLANKPIYEFQYAGTILQVFPFRYLKGKAEPLEESYEVSWFPLSQLPDPVSPEPEVFQAATRYLTKAAHDTLRNLFERLPDSFIVVPDWASISGSLVYGLHQPNDIDVILRTNAPTGSLLKLQRAIHSVLGSLPVQFLVEPEGPTWSFLRLYDLVAVKKPKFEIEDLHEPEFAAQFYKAREATTVRGIKHGVPAKHYGVAGEFYWPKETRLAWDKWARRLVERGETILVQPKFDGVRLHIDYDGKTLHVWSDQGDDRAKVFPGLKEALDKAGLKNVILDCEFVQCQDGKHWKPVPRTEMGWMGSAKEPMLVPITIFIHDIMWWRGKKVAEEPYIKRLELIKELLPRPVVVGRYRFYPTPTWAVRSWPAFKKAVDKAVGSTDLSSEGAMLKVASFIYDPTEARTDVVKMKRLIELDTLILGYRKVAAPKPPGKKLTRSEAFKYLRDELKRSNTYQLRLALLDEVTGDLVPVVSKRKLSASDLKLDFDDVHQRWIGLDDPRLWTMFPGVPIRKEGDYAYGNSYNIRLDTPPEPGMIFTIAPMALTPFKDDAGWHLTWQHPIPRNEKTKGHPIGSIQAALTAHGMDPSKYQPWADVFRRPKWAK